jgi:hypothetical protein
MVARTGEQGAEQIGEDQKQLARITFIAAFQGLESGA